MRGLDGMHRASSSRIGPKASARSRRLTTIGLSRRFLAGSNAAADNYRIGNARSSFHGGLSRTRGPLPPPPPSYSSIAWFAKYKVLDRGAQLCYRELSRSIPLFLIVGVACSDPRNAIS